MSTSVIVAGARTPIGKLSGALSSLTAADLGGRAIAAALERSGIAADEVDAVVMGTVVQAGVGPNPARQAAVTAGLPMTVPATTVNNLCLSGLEAIMQADRLIATGAADVVVAGGMESMTNAPYLVRGARQGLKYGSTGFEDALDRDALTCAFDGISMGASTERYQASENISRAEQDEFAARSHRLAAEATASGVFTAEIAPVEVASRRGTVMLAVDEGIRAETTVESLGRLRPAFAQGGIITAGASSQLSDGAAAVVVMRKDLAEARGIPWLVEIRAHALVAGPDTSLLYQPANAIEAALKRDGEITVADLDLIEINEAFAGVALVSMRQLGVDAGKVNIHGGAIAVGHPVGMSGARLALSLGYSLKSAGGGAGAVALCGGGGQGIAMIVSA
ncbi:acetyl-CoA C-acyltransferase (plasmid) [Rhodococcus pyridinivorans]|uniref:acetyl-CoA C-acyltransferase n=1 Tax=Rhodococcus pyridinivorans TaxID=103816 RepID=UPI0020C69EC5|nr:acetyl-CoA C-acyltransferase [Rhodococcus pyridinivorans]UTM39685.1 acetyl-CoA C-acyltransferase [Rhodococcus pyridinivorans]